MAGIPSYPKIHNLGHRVIADIFDGPVLVQEKVDGSQISFGRLDNRLWVRSKGATLVEGAQYTTNVTVDGMFKTAVEQIRDRFADLPNDVVFRGEYLMKPKHNTLAYDRVPAGNIALFDAQDADGSFLPEVSVGALAFNLGFDVVPLLDYDVKFEHADQVREYLKRESFLGGPLVEGVVLKAHDRFNAVREPMFGKFVSEAFKETHTKAWREENPPKQEFIARLAEQYRAPARWEKAIQRLRERGTLQNAPQDIGMLLGEIKMDVIDECVDEIKDALWKRFQGDILRGATKGFPEWYKQRLLDGAFEETA